MSVKKDQVYLSQKSWEEKAQQNPLYAVMSDAAFTESGAAPTEEELTVFFQAGKEKVDDWINPWLARAGESDSLRVLEYGCGMGRLLRHIKGPPQMLSGVDISKTMVEHARSYAVGAIDFRVLDVAGNIPWPDASFNRVFSYAVFQHIRNRSMLLKAVGEIARVLEPGGQVKLQFEMAYPPKWLNPGWLRGGDSHGFENVTLVWNWTRKFGLPIWYIRAIGNNNWRGVRMGFRQLIHAFHAVGITITGVERIRGGYKGYWFYGVKGK